MKIYSSICDNSQDNDNANIIYKNKMRQCLRQKKFMEYSVKVKDHSTNWKNTTSVSFSIRFSEKVTNIYEEVFIFDNIGLISSLGGALGLFVGFSFFGYIGSIIDKIVDKGIFKNRTFECEDGKLI